MRLRGVNHHQWTQLLCSDGFSLWVAQTQQLPFFLPRAELASSFPTWLSTIAVLNWALLLDTPSTWAAHQKYPKRAQSDPSWRTPPGPQRDGTGSTSHSGCVLSARCKKEDRRHHFNQGGSTAQSDLYQHFKAESRREVGEVGKEQSHERRILGSMEKEGNSAGQRGRNK